MKTKCQLDASEDKPCFICVSSIRSIGFFKGLRFVERVKNKSKPRIFT